MDYNEILGDHNEMGLSKISYISCEDEWVDREILQVPSCRAQTQLRGFTLRKVLFNQNEVFDRIFLCKGWLDHFQRSVRAVRDFYDRDYTEPQQIPAGHPLDGLLDNSLSGILVYLILHIFDDKPRMSPCSYLFII